MPENVAARINLGTLCDTIGDASQAEAQFQFALQYGVESIEQAQLVHEFLEKKGDYSRLRELWSDYLKQYPDVVLARSFLAWALVLEGKSNDAREQIARIGVPAARSILIAQATVALLALEEGREDVVQLMGDRLVSEGDAATRRRLLRALERFDGRKPGNPWTYYLTALLLHSDGQLDAARAFLDLFANQCSGSSCATALAALEAKLRI